MDRKQILQILKNTGVMLEGHFKLTSGKHSNKYMQCAKLFVKPMYGEAMCKALAEKLPKEVNLVVGPAIGGVLVAYEVARQLGVDNVFGERENGKMTLRRGFSVQKGMKAVVVEDVVTTGGSVQEVIDMLTEMGVEVVAVGSLIDRSQGKAKFGSLPYFSVISVELDVYEPNNCPLCADGSVAYKPGSRA